MKVHLIAFRLDVQWAPALPVPVKAGSTRPQRMSPATGAIWHNHRLTRKQELTQTSRGARPSQAKMKLLAER